MITLLITADGRREFLPEALASARENLPIDVDPIVFDDSGDPDYRAWLAELGLEVWTHEDGARHGHAAAMAEAWERLAGRSGYVFHLEDDFRLDRPVPLFAMIEVLEAFPELAQIALLRQPWFPGERAAGGIVERDPDAYELVDLGSEAFLQHRRWFTLNPCLYRVELCALGWPQVARHEWTFSRRLVDDGFHFALWGRGEQWVTHLGHYRKAHR